MGRFRGRFRVRVRIPVRVRVCVVCVGYAKNDSLTFANGTEAIASANLTSVEQGWQSPFGDFRRFVFSVGQRFLFPFKAIHKIHMFFQLASLMPISRLA